MSMEQLRTELTITCYVLRGVALQVLVVRLRACCRASSSRILNEEAH